MDNNHIDNKLSWESNGSCSFFFGQKKKKRKEENYIKQLLSRLCFFFLHHFSQGLFIIGGKTKKKMKQIWNEWMYLNSFFCDICGVTIPYTHIHTIVVDMIPSVRCRRYPLRIVHVRYITIVVFFPNWHLLASFLKKQNNSYSIHPKISMTLVS